MRKAMIAAVAAGLMAIAAPALAGPGGSSETSGNEVTCGGTNVAGATSVSAGGDGIVACNDGTPASPANVIQGRVILSSSGYAAADGDASNPAQARGWARLDASGIRCGGPDDPGSGTNAETPGGGSMSYCG